MKRRSLNLFLTGIILSFCATHCSNTEENSVPTPPAPAVDPATTVPTTPTTPDSRLPSWVTKAAPIQLPKERDYSGLQDLFGIVYPPLVGDPSLAMDLKGNRQRTIEGTLHFGFEDKKDFQYIDIPSVISAGYRDSNYFDGYFSDDSGVVRIVGSITDNVLSGQFLYRVRVNGETNCQEYVQCYYDPYAGQYQCQKTTDVNACRNYMTSSQSQKVKLLGTFNASYLNWFSN